jgi:beta-galactosidase
VDGGASHALLRLTLGNGQVLAVDSFVGVRYWQERYSDFETFVHGAAAAADALPAIRCSIANGEILQWRFGRSGRVPLLFLIYGGEGADIEVHFSEPAVLSSASITDVTTDECLRLEGSILRLKLARESYRILRFNQT